MSFVTCLALLFLLLAPSDQPAMGFLEGHLRIYAPQPIEPEGGAATKIRPEMYAEFPLVVLGQDGRKEIARVTADKRGNYRLPLPPGAYVLDIYNRWRKHVRATPAHFIIRANHTTRVDMDMDPGVQALQQ